MLREKITWDEFYFNREKYKKNVDIYHNIRSKELCIKKISHSGNNVNHINWISIDSYLNYIRFSKEKDISGRKDTFLYNNKKLPRCFEEYRMIKIEEYKNTHDYVKMPSELSLLLFTGECGFERLIIKIIGCFLLIFVNGGIKGIFFFMIPNIIFHIFMSNWLVMKYEMASSYIDNTNINGCPFMSYTCEFETCLKYHDMIKEGKI